MNKKLLSLYGLKWNPNPPVTVPQLVAIALATGVYTILAWIGVISLPFQERFVSQTARIETSTASIRPKRHSPTKCLKIKED